MTVDVAFTTPDLDELVGALERFHSDQLPFALSLAMNRSARDAVLKTRSALSSVFNLRRRSLRGTFGPSGRIGDVTRGWSNKRQWPDLKVVLHSKAFAMALQEAGGIKPFAAKEVWIATRYVPRTKSGRVLQRYQPSRIRNRLASERQRGKTRVFERGRRVFERERESGEHRPIYIRHSKAVVDPVLGYEKIITNVYAAKLGPRFAQAMARASRTRRTR